MKILRAADYKRMPWKNGGGETVEIAVFPLDASIDDFEWRISMATVAEHGSFSTFPGIDRSLTVLEGEGVELRVDGRHAASVRLNSRPYTFPADAATDARLIGGPVRDLNIMTRRGRFGHQVCRMKIYNDRDVGAAFVTTFVMVISETAVDVAGTTLGYLETVILGPGETTAIGSSGSADVVIAKISAA